MKDIEVVKVRNIVEQVVSYTGWMHNAKTKEGRKLKFDVWKCDSTQVAQYADEIQKLLVKNNINVISVTVKHKEDPRVHNIVILLAFNTHAKLAGAYTVNEIIELCDPSDELSAAIQTIVTALEQKLE